jgi:predicted Zn-dependent protease
MSAQVAWAAGKPDAENVLLNSQANAEAFGGHMRKARELLRLAVESARANSDTETGAGYDLDMAVTEADYGVPEMVGKDIADAASLNPHPDAAQRAQAAIALARAGDVDRASRLADELAEQFPQNTEISKIDIPSVRAAIEIHRNNPAGAIQSLESVRAYEMGSADALYSAYLRGLAYLLLHKGGEAATEFQKVVNHPYIVQTSEEGALARLGLARAYVEQGDSAKARAAYKDFLSLWKSADPDIPVLRAAKLEYAKLK